MIDTPKTTLLNNIDDLDLTFTDGENELEFDIDGYSFTITYSLEEDDFFTEDDEEIKGDKKLKVLSINAYDNIEDDDIDVNVDEDMQKLFSDYYKNTLNDEEYEPLDVNFGEFSDFMD